MKYVTPPGQAAGSSYIDLDAATKTIGSVVVAAAIENPMREWEALIKGAGLTPDEKNLAQGLEAVQKIAQGFVKAIGVLSAKSPLAVTNNGDLTGTVELSVATASETVAGVSERATDAEAASGTDVVRHVTPKHLKTGLDQKADTGHSHTTAQVTGLDAALGGKAAASHSHTTAQITGLDTALGGKAPTSHSHTTAQVTGLDTALAAKAAASHGHAVGDLSGVLPIASGGTGATTAAAARNALGLGNTTTALPVANGGTGATTAAAARTALEVPFTLSKAANGYYTLPGGLIIQWGTVTVAIDASLAFLFPIAFPSACYSIVANGSVKNVYAGGAAQTAATFSALSKTGATINNDCDAQGYRWIAIGV